MRIDRYVREQVFRDFLGGFDFRGDNALAPVGRFSGGEKSRLALALIAWQRPNVLLLDEPTNHLDIEMRLALTRALQDYDGAMVLVSHDRSLLRAACDELYLVEGGHVREFEGDLEDYTQHLAAGGSVATSQPNSGLSRKEQRRVEADARARSSNRRKPVESELRKLETEMDRLGADKARLEKRMAAPDLYDDARKEDLKQCMAEQARIARRLAEIEERWLALSAELEALANG